MTDKLNKRRDEHEHHEHLVAGIKAQMQVVLDKSEQAIEIYLDDVHKTANLKAAKLFGFDTVAEFEGFEGNFLESFVSENDQQKVMDNYHDAFAQKLKATVLDVTMRNKDGKETPVRLTHVPMVFSNHLFAVGFIDVV